MSGPETTLVVDAPVETRPGLLRWLARLEGEQTVGRGPVFWGVVGLAIAGAAIYPLFSDGYTVGNSAYFLVWTFMAMGLCVVWGYGGALSFGQTAFFGLAGYAYGVPSPFCCWMSPPTRCWQRRTSTCRSNQLR